MNYKLSEKGKKLLHSRESCRLNAYQDTKGIWTVGWGFTYHIDGRPVKKGDKITQAQADQMFDVIGDRDFEKPLNNLLKDVKLNQDQYDALLSFCYNVGISAFSGSTMLKHLKASKIKDANKQFARWVFPPEITGRRKAESRQFAGIEFSQLADTDPLVGWL